MPDEKRYIVRSEPLPLAFMLTEAQAKLAMKRAVAAQALMQHPAWTMIAADVRGDRIVGHTQVCDGQSALALRLSNIVGDVLHGQIDLAGELGLYEPGTGECPTGREWHQKEAEAAIARAQVMKDFTQQPAYQWLSQLLGDVAMASRYAIEHGTGGDIEYHVAVQQRVAQFFDDLQRDVDLGMDAQTWIDQKHKEIAEREENKNA